MPTATAPVEAGRPDRSTGTPTWSARVRAACNRPVAADSVAVFRICFGVLACLGSARFLLKGWVGSLYLDPAHHLTFAGFDWVRPWPGPWMYVHVAALAVLGLCVALGYRTRPAAALFTLGFAYTELIDASLYLNHYWYMTLAGLLVALLPLHHRWSLDARAGRVAPSPVVPVAALWTLRAQLAVVYLFAGAAKLNADWLLHGRPLGLWLADRTAVPFVGPFLDEPFVGFVASWTGAAFDLTIVGWLLWRRSRPWAYVAVIGFHVGTAMLFQIGMFPWVMILGTLVFFEPDWPRRFAARVRPAVALRRVEPSVDRPHGPRPRVGTVLLVVLAALAVIELALPLRHLAYPGNVRWTEEGYYLSWRVMLTEKAGHLRFRVTDPDEQRTWIVGPDLVLTDWQASQAAIRPDLLRTTAGLIADVYAEQGLGPVEVRADSFVSMNGAPARRLVDPAVDLAAVPRGPGADAWILPAPGAAP